MYIIIITDGEKERVEHNYFSFFLPELLANIHRFQPGHLIAKKDILLKLNLVK
jgi:hypothetical protein